MEPWSWRSAPTPQRLLLVTPIDNNASSFTATPWQLSSWLRSAKWKNICLRSECPEIKILSSGTRRVALVMMAAALIQRLDGWLESLTSNWNIYTTVLCVVIAGYSIYPLIFSTEADTHYFLLARQSSASRVRQAGETSVYRCPEIPHGYPLKSGLSVKDAGAPKWSMGRDGDLRDVWRRALAGQLDEHGKPKVQPGKVFTLLGKEEALETSFEKLSEELNAIGKHLKNHGSSRVAIYLPNSPQLLVSLFGKHLDMFSP